MTLIIKNWDQHFENSHSRKVKKAAWLPLPNKMDGKGYRRIVKMKNATDILTAWIIILQVASKMPERGILKDEDGDITTEDLSIMSGFPEKIFKSAIPVLKSPKISWLECDSTTMEQDVAEQNRTEQKEQNGMEQKERNEFIVEIVDFLNHKLNTSYRPDSEKTKSCINARLNDGFTIDDFKRVIDTKYRTWFNTNMAKFLRPETLFGTKFESYLNEKQQLTYDEQIQKLKDEDPEWQAMTNS